jgi:isopentenyl diphosphate isomerase/L-lactate dehydrogenase-like FMN-dependent dehydrogenase
MANRSGPAEGELKCHRCAICDGYGCPGMLPGLGGVFEGKNFQLNCEGWHELFDSAVARGLEDKIRAITVGPEQLRCGPVTGAVENIGYAHEADFYFPYLCNALEAGLGLCVGDGCPDEKLKLGAAAVRELQLRSGAAGTIQAAFFLKPYPQEKLFERVEWIRPYASHIGIDIDSYNIVTMRNLVNLERKTAAQLEEFRAHTKLPFVIKGVFTDDDLELVREVRPDVVYISNHGGRVETRIGSTAQFLAEKASELKKYCKEIWVDGGIRTKQDVQTALYYGADQVIAARPLIRATFDNHYSETVKELLESKI